MTICAAGINHAYRSKKSIIAVCDRKLSLGPISAEGIAWKIQTIHPKWRVMYSGPTSPMAALLDAVKTATANAKYEHLRSFARLCSRAYREERKHIVETEILAEYDIDSYADYQALKLKDRPFFDALGEQIKKAEEEWNLLFLGFDNTDNPHLFVIAEYGKIQYCDAEGFAAIGSGAWPAWAALSRFGFNRFLPRGEAMYAVLSAKFAAEGAEGVGKETVFLIFKPTDRLGWSVPVLGKDKLAEIRDKWENLPRIPDGVAQSLEEYLSETEGFTPLKVDNPLRGYFKRSKSRKSK